MFGKRKDGKELKNINPYFKLIPNIMMERADAQVYFNQDIMIKGMDEYIDKNLKDGIKLSYMDIIFAAVVRIIALRPQLNRFAINGRIYARNQILLSVVIKKALSDDADETSLKIPFNGDETIFEVKEKLGNMIKENKKIETENSTDKFVNILSKTPSSIIKWAVRIIKRLDKKGNLPKFLIDLSPFHTSAFITNVGSIGIDSIYHHLYNFGTTSMFFAMGKKKKSFIFEEDEIKETKCINFAFVGDERICDGYYFASSFRLLCKYLNKPELLEEKTEVRKEIESI